MAPIRALMEGSDGNGSIVRYALIRAKVDAPHRGSRQFQHALAAHIGLERGLLADQLALFQGSRE